MKKTVLIVEDGHAIAHVYRVRLEYSDYDVVHCENGLIALNHLKTESPDIVLLDLRMPVMDGETFLKRLRKSKTLPQLPVIVLTNISRDEAPRTLWHYGIDGYYIKANHTPKELVELVDSILV
jgi:two-component system response regulator AdeR